MIQPFEQLEENIFSFRIGYTLTTQVVLLAVEDVPKLPENFKKT